MLPITRATLQSFCRVCLRELSASAASTREPNHNINEDQFFKVLQSISGVTMKSSELSLYPQCICHSCYVKTNAFLKFREKAIVGTGILKLLVAESLQEAALVKLKSYCRVCLRKGNSTNDNSYTTEKNGEVFNYALECTGLHLAEDNNAVDALSDDSRFPSVLCSRCYATLKNFMEFRAVSKQTKIYLKGILDGVDEDQEESKNKKEKSHRSGDEDSTKLMEHEIVVEQLPICNSIKNEFSHIDDSELDIDYDCEMPIEVQMNIDDGEGIDLDAVDIKKEFNSDDDIKLIFKTENLRPSLVDGIAETATTKRSRTKKVSKLENEFELWDSNSTESSSSDDDSDFEDKKRKRKILNKNKKIKSKYMSLNLKDINDVPRTRNSIKAKTESKTSKNVTKNETDCEDGDTTTSNNNSIDKLNNKKVKNLRETFKCDECNKNFYKKYMYEAHMKGVHEGIEKPFDCQYCDSSFRSVQLLHRHVNVRHSLEIVSDNADDYPFTMSNTISRRFHLCMYCQRPFRRKDHLNEHIRAVHKGLRPYVCKICGKTFGSKNTQLRHEKNHSNVRPYACEYCGKRYNSGSELKVHIQRHTTSPDLLCPICKRGKPNAEELKKHIAMHEASRQHQCPKCGKVFTKLFHLREHDSAVHLKLRPFKCNQCDQTFGIRKTLKTHERRHDPTDRPEYCNLCNLYFKTKRSLVLHIKKIHSNEEDIQEKQDTADPDSV